MRFEIKEEDRVVHPVFSLYSDIDGLINARETFIQEGDPTGYKWAMKYLKSWEHFEQLMEAGWFRKAYEKWMQELKSKLQSEALEKIKEIASEDSSQALAAAKYLATHEWENKPRRGLGRPTKDQITGELKKAVQVLTEEDLDAQRMGLTLIKGGKGN